jgi:hypothetical protein
LVEIAVRIGITCLAVGLWRHDALIVVQTEVPGTTLHDLTFRYSHRRIAVRDCIGQTALAGSIAASAVIVMNIASLGVLELLIHQAAAVVVQVVAHLGLRILSLTDQA